MGVKFTPIVDDIAYYGGEEVFLCYPEMLYPVWKKIGMSKFLRRARILVGLMKFNKHLSEIKVN